MFYRKHTHKIEDGKYNLPIRAVRSVRRVGSHFEMVKHDVDLLVGSGDENVGAIRAWRVVGRIAWRIELAPLATGTSVSEGARAVRRSSTRNAVL